MRSRRHGEGFYLHFMILNPAEAGDTFWPYFSGNFSHRTCATRARARRELGAGCKTDQLGDAVGFFFLLLLNVCLFVCCGSVPVFPVFPSQKRYRKEIKIGDIVTSQTAAAILFVVFVFCMQASTALVW